MPKTRIVIGPFRRRAFAEALALSLESDPWISISRIDDEGEVASLLNDPEPVVIVLEQQGDDGWRRFLPVSESVSVILIAEEGQGDVQVALRNIGLQRMRTAIGLLAETPHPKVMALDTEFPLALEPIKNGACSGLARAIAWLDAAFVVALDRYAVARGEPVETPWMQDLSYLQRHFARDAAITAAVEADRFAAMIDSPGWPQRLLGNLGLAPEELKLLCLAAAPDLDQRYGQAIGLLQNNYAESRPNATTLAMFLSDEHIGADVDALLSGARSFARLKMIRKEGGAPQPGYRVPSEILELMYGIRRCSGPDWWLQTSALDAGEQLAADLKRVLDAPLPPLVLCGTGEPHVAGELASAVLSLDIPVLRVDCAKAGTAAGQRIADWVLLARIHDAILLMEGVDALGPVDRGALLDSDIGDLARGQILIGTTASPRYGGRRGAAYIAVPRPPPSLIAARWRSAIAAQGLEISEAEAQHFGGVLRLPPEEILTISQIAGSAARLDETASNPVYDVARHHAARHAPDTVRCPPCIFGWDDIVLPPATKRLVQSIPDHVRLGPMVLDTWNFASRLPYGRGIGALFSGPSGTGKTMCAQVIAGSLGVALMQVEIARCVSKYIGETEKNIDRCFAAAEVASAVLLFDEADALFGKRTEIKDAHDRYANVEVAYLLQRIEAYEGLVILTTNLKTNVDHAFLRRLRFCIDFPMPGAADRSRIWQLSIPHGARCAADVDTGFLARRLPLSGGSIQVIAVNAAFAAAAEGAQEIGMDHIMAATRVELIKNGMLSTERDLPEPLLSLAEGAAP